MTNCWSEGALRAWLDRELPAADMKAVAAHLGECSTCDAVCTELAARAARVFSMLETLGEPATAVAAAVMAKPRPMPSLASSRWLWTGAAVALAAGLAIASFVVQKRQEAVPAAQAVIPVVEAPPIAVQAVDQPPAPVAQSAVARTLPRKRAPKPAGDYFLALDDEPIESGVIMRVAIQPGNAQADIVFDPGGRARAIRLVSNKY